MTDEIITDGAQLCSLVGLDPALADPKPDFPVRVPRPLVDRIRAGDPNDPLLRQLLPTAAERDPRAPGSEDPLDERRWAPIPGLLHKYRGRALLLLTSACVVHCRFCFRRHRPTPALSRRARGRALEYLAADPSIEEVILSGGDPLTLGDADLAGWIHDLAAIDSLRRLRIHSRAPLATPARVTPGLTRSLGATRLACVVVLHANCAAELSPTAVEAVGRLADARLTLLNQAVLLRGVNDTVQAQKQLSRALVQARILPYYLHQLDPVRGAHHFAVPDNEALQLHASMRAELPGYMVPRLVRDTPGETSKRPLI